jgi:hypothetical protein
MLNPLAIGVTLGGQLLDLFAPRPKPRAGFPAELSLVSQRTVTRTLPVTAADEFGDARLGAVCAGGGPDRRQVRPGGGALTSAAGGGLR